MEEQILPQSSVAPSHTLNTTNITLGIDSDDFFFSNAIGQEIFETLQGEGYKVQPVYTGERSSSELLILIQNAEVFVRDNHALISEGLGDLSGLIGIIGTILPLLKKMRQAIVKQTSTEDASTMVKLIIIIDGHPITVEVDDIDKEEAALVLAHQINSKHPQVAQKASPAQSKVKVQIHTRKTRQSKKRQ